MEKYENLKEFYDARGIESSGALHPWFNHYNVFRLEEKGFVKGAGPAKYCKRDFFKIALVRGLNRCHYANKSLEIAGDTLLFFNPKVPYTWEPLSDQSGYYTIFKEPFYSEGLKLNVNNFSMFAPGGKSSYPLTKDQEKEVSLIFEKMLKEQQSDYIFKDDLARGYINELIHFALKHEPSEKIFAVKSANSRIVSVFQELLHRQFLMDGSVNLSPLKTPKEYAAQLCVHVNHLNRAVREITGKTTSQLIGDKVVGEAQAYLRSSSMNITEIGRILGFEEPAHFYKFYKKRTGLPPSVYRNTRGD